MSCQKVETEDALSLGKNSDTFFVISICALLACSLAFFHTWPHQHNKMVSCWFVYSLWFRLVQLMYRQFAPGVSFLSSLDLVSLFYLSSVFGAYRNHYWLCSVLRCEMTTSTQNSRFWSFFFSFIPTLSNRQIDTEWNCRKWRAKNDHRTHFFPQFPIGGALDFLFEYVKNRRFAWKKNTHLKLCNNNSNNSSHWATTGPAQSISMASILFHPITIFAHYYKHTISIMIFLCVLYIF